MDGKIHSKIHSIIEIFIRVGTARQAIVNRPTQIIRESVSLLTIKSK